jgi:hypothetical protein
MIQIPKKLEMHYFLNEFVLCCCKRAWYKEYNRVIGITKADVDKNVDILVFLRRFRMHGIALTLLLGKLGRMFAANKAIKKSFEGLKNIETGSKVKSWNELE